MSATSDSKQFAQPAARSPQPALRWRAVAFRLVCASLGLLLLTAAYLKFRDLTWEPFGKALFIPPNLRVIFIEAEAILGVWLLLSVARRALWSVAVLYFTALAGVSLYLAFHGEPTCGCFGQATVSPWLTFAIDLAAVGALIFTHRGAGGCRTQTAPARKARIPAVMLWTSAVMAAVVAVQVIQFGGLVPAWEALTAQTVAAEPVVTEIGSGVAGSRTIFSVTVHNHDHRPVQTVGGTRNCVVNATLDLPVIIPAGESRSIQVEGHFSGSPGRFIREYGFVTDQAAGRIVMARFGGTVLAKP